jgi:hypothetical protein
MIPDAIAGALGRHRRQSRASVIGVKAESTARAAEPDADADQPRAARHAR